MVASGTNPKLLSDDIIVDPIDLDSEQGTDHPCTNSFVLLRVPDYRLCVFSHVSCDSEEDEMERSPVEVANKPLEVVVDDSDDGDGGRGHDVVDNQGKCDIPCSIDTLLQHSADEEIPGHSDFVESDFDWKVIINHFLLHVMLFLASGERKSWIFSLTVNLILLQNQSLDVVSDAADSNQISSSSTSTSTSTSNPSEDEGILFPCFKIFQATFGVLLFC